MRIWISTCGLPRMALKSSKSPGRTRQEAQICRHCLHGIALLLLAGNGAAAEQSTETPVQPDPELLEFLGSFATDEGEWIDPDSLLETEFATLLDRAATTFRRQTDEADAGNDQDSDND